MAQGPSKGFPEVFTTAPAQSAVRKAGQLSEEQVKQYFEKGFLIVENLFTPEELQPVIDGVNELVDKLANKLFDAGKIKDKHEDASFEKRLILLEREWEGAPILLLKRGFMPEGFKSLWSQEKLLNIVEQFIGPDISGHPIWNLRTKTPGRVETTVPWHQDNAYIEEGCDRILIPTAWIPLVDANIKNGCMMVAPGGHKTGMTAKHSCCVGPTWYVQVEEDEIRKTLEIDPVQDSVICEVPFGGVLFINNVIPHKSMLNSSDKIRWSLDLRYNRTQDYNYFYGVKESVPMRKAGVKDFKIDWTTFESAEDQYIAEAEFAKQAGKLSEIEPIKIEDPFDTTVVGPWMTRWEIVNHNKHTAAFQSAGNA